jgi:hypothetical protein
MTPAFVFVFAPLAPMLLDEAAQQLAKDATAALDQSGWTPKSAAGELDVPLNKLYDQLNGKAPLTYLWRMLVGLDGFRCELFDIQGQRAGLFLLRHTDLQRLVRGVESLSASLSAKRRMAKAALTQARQEQAS